jgi:hypothetical protein
MATQGRLQAWADKLNEEIQAESKRVDNYKSWSRYYEDLAAQKAGH